MSEVGKTLLRGHGLRSEGAPLYDKHGKIPWGYDDGEYAKCECGALSPAGISQNAAKRWHREHKDAVRALSAHLSASEGGQAHGDGTSVQGSVQGDTGGKR